MCEIARHSRGTCAAFAQKCGQINALQITASRQILTGGFDKLTGSCNKTNKGDIMDLANAVAHFNWLAIITAAAAAFALGGAWYAKVLFGSAWMQDVGLTEEDAKNANMPRTFGGAFVLQLIAAMMLAAIIGPESTWLSGAYTGLLLGLGFLATAYGVTYLFEQRSLRLFMINAGYNVVLLGIMGAIIGGWH